MIALTIAGIVATLAAGFGVYWWSKRSNRKQLSYDYSVAKIASIENDFAGDLKIMFQERVVSDVSLLALTVRNSGAIPILRSDFDQPVTFTLPKAGGFLAQQVSRTKPDGLSVEADKVCRFELDESVLGFSPLLLNPNDEFTLLALVSGLEGDIEVGGRIVGVQRIERKRMEASSNRLFGYGLLAGVVSSALPTILVARGILKHGWVGALIAVYIGFGLAFLPEIRRSWNRAE